MDILNTKMTLPPYSGRREEELRRKIEEEERRRRQIAEELARPVPENQEIQLEATTAGRTLEGTMEQLRRKYFVRGVGMGGLVGAVGGAAFGYAMDRYQWAQSQNLPREGAFDYQNTVIAGILCLALGASVGALVALWYGRRTMEKVAGEHTEGEDEERGGR